MFSSKLMLRKHSFPDKNRDFQLSRFKYNLKVYQLGETEVFNLVKTLKKQGSLDQWVILGDQAQLKCRLVAVPLPDQVVNERRRKAKNDRHSKVVNPDEIGANHSKEYMQLLAFNIFITNVDEKIWSAQEVMEAYKCRWYIEILFKLLSPDESGGWKSHLNLVINIPDRYINKQRIEQFFYMMLLMLTLVVMPIFRYLQQRVSEQGKNVSILALCTFIRNNMDIIISAENYAHILEKAEYYCLYDQRKQTRNTLEIIFFHQP